MSIKQQWEIPREIIRELSWGDVKYNFLHDIEVKSYRLSYSRSSAPAREFSENELLLVIAQLEIAKEKVVAGIQEDIDLVKSIIAYNKNKEQSRE